MKNPMAQVFKNVTLRKQDSYRNSAFRKQDSYRNSALGVWCAAFGLRQAARSGGKHYQLSFASWLLRIISSYWIVQLEKKISR